MTDIILGLKQVKQRPLSGTNMKRKKIKSIESKFHLMRLQLCLFLFFLMILLSLYGNDR